jgi:hypothetical protein
VAELGDGAELVVPELAPDALAAGELAPDELAAGELLGLGVVEPGAELEAAGAVGAADVAALAIDVAAVAVDLTGDAAEVRLTATVDPVDVWVGVSGGRAAFDAWAGREKISKIVRIPAAASAACIAPRAMRRINGCSMSSSQSTRTGPHAYPRATAVNPAYLGLLFGHHRTV